jgi:hypothetical protein
MLTSFARMPDPTVHANSWKMLQTGQKLAKENAETNGWNVTEESIPPGWAALLSYRYPARI